MIPYTPVSVTRGNGMVYGHLLARLLPPGSNVAVPEPDGAAGSPAAPSVFYLGYPLSLSDTELDILLLLLSAAVRAPDADASWVSRTEVARAFACPDSPYPGRVNGLPVSQIPVYVSRINRKALPIGGRRLIDSHPGKGYRINPYM